MSLHPESPPIGRGHDARETRIEACAVGLVGGKVEHFVVQALPRQDKIAAIRREDRKRGTVSEGDRSCRAVLVGCGKFGVEDLQSVKAARHKRTQEIEGENEHLIRKTRREQPRTVKQSEVGGNTGV